MENWFGKWKGRPTKTKVLATGMITLFFITKIIYSCSNETNETTQNVVILDKTDLVFTGLESCASCHQQEWKDWENSHHDLAMKEATEEYVRGNFDNATFRHRDEQYRFYKEEDKFMVETAGPDGNNRSYTISYTFGWTPLQQYLIKYERGKYQALNIAWDTEKKEWFALNPSEDIAHGDWLHWTGGAMNWNTMCADCHSTNLRQNYFAEQDSFHTTWSSINVSCESCHGPGGDHVALMHSDSASQVTLDRIRADLKLTNLSTPDELINQCASCHSLREKLTPGYQHTGDFLNHYNPNLPHPESYFADGQIEGEVYVYASFLQSKMYKHDVQCQDCHDPHTLDLRFETQNNALCMQCHEPEYNEPTHHFHEVDTKGAQCISCHMPGRYYMEVDYRRDHSFRIPRPDLSERYGTPNACNDCHNDKSSAWAARAIERWYGEDRPAHFSEVWLQADSMLAETIPALGHLMSDTSQNDLVRATTAWYLGQFPDDQSLVTLSQYVQDSSALVRSAAVRAIVNLQMEGTNSRFDSALTDSVLAVRLGAARGLTGITPLDIPARFRTALGSAREEYLEYLYTNQYFPSGQMNLGLYYEGEGETAKAIDAYQRAIRKDGYFNTARMNLAYLYNQLGQNEQAEDLFTTIIQQEPHFGPAHYYLALLMAEENKLNNALPHFEEAARLMPENDRIHYNQAIALQQLQLPEQAEKAYQSALRLAPENPDYIYGISTLYIQQNRFEEALPFVQRLLQLYPQNQQFQQMLQMIRQGIQ